MYATAKTRDLMALCRNLGTDLKEERINTLIESLTRITYRALQNQEGLEEDAVARNVAGRDRGLQYQLSEGVKRQAKVVKKNKTEVADNGGHGNKGEKVLGSKSEEGLMAQEDGEKPSVYIGAGEENYSKEWSFKGRNCGDGRGALKGKSLTRMNDRGEPTKFYLKSAGTVFNQNRPLYQSLDHAEALKRRINLL